ncbi:MAG TPA: hypothetical protein VG389_28925 [Myxococcota bacterium]|jgi:hypothetical protein|nr:hypothetical protein [Myxococcota bacterium]
MTAPRAPPKSKFLCASFKTYGLLLADNGSDWYVSGAPDPSGTTPAWPT